MQPVGWYGSLLPTLEKLDNVFGNSQLVQHRFSAR
jgi:hypothetical protein